MFDIVYKCIDSVTRRRVLTQRGHVSHICVRKLVGARPLSGPMLVYC